MFGAFNLPVHCFWEILNLLLELDEKFVVVRFCRVKGQCHNTCFQIDVLKDFCSRKLVCTFIFEEIFERQLFEPSVTLSLF